MRKRISFAHLPTPLSRPRRLGDAMGIDLVVKRDDMTGGAAAGNKIRKLEFLLAEALEQGADTIITCGGIQSNHARATAILASSLGIASVLFLRTTDPSRVPDELLQGNALLDRMVGAEIRPITVEQYRRRNEIMEQAAEEIRQKGGRPYVIPEGGSNGLGSLGYVEAMAEVRRQLDLGLAGGKAFDVVVHACGSGGTAAGLVLGSALHFVAAEVRSMAVCDDGPTFETIIDRIVAEARSLEPSLRNPARLVVDDRWRGPAYAVSTEAQRNRIVQAARLSGLIFDPVYTGKAFAGLWEICASGELRGKRVLFLHTGGLPGLLAQGPTFAEQL